MNSMPDAHTTDEVLDSAFTIYAYECGGGGHKNNEIYRGSMIFINISGIMKKGGRYQCT